MKIDTRDSDLTGVKLEQVGKKFRSQWIFKNISLDLQPGDKLNISGFNGSGKSTLLQVISGYITPTEGKVLFQSTSGILKTESFYHYISFASPYLELIEEFTLQENAAFYCKHKKMQAGITGESIIEITGLKDSANKQIKYFSSGMRQRVKLALAFLSDTSLLLLDEPLSNLDESGYKWYQNLAGQIDNKRMVVVCSNNVQQETFFCTKSLNIEDYK